MEKSNFYVVNKNVPFPLAYLDWCKTTKRIKTLKETENHTMVMEFWQIYSKTGGCIEPWEIVIAKGESIK